MYHSLHISIHAAHEGPRRRKTPHDHLAEERISIHAAHEGPRLKENMMRSKLLYFNPRGPRGTATSICFLDADKTVISIHAAHEGPRQS